MTDALRTVGRYDLLEVIGRGGAATVYLAHQRDLERRVALKELAPVRAADQTFARRFVAESRLTGSMNHANVVTVHEFFEEDGVPYIAMEYLPRGSLRQYIGGLGLAQVAGVLEGVLAGLSHGARVGIVHRDLKPENLLVTEDGRVKIADYGVARAYNRAAAGEAITTTGATIGTPAYMAPEQALGRELTPAADLYSLGVIAWEMLAGRVPFEETDTPMAVLYRHVHEPMPAIETVVPDIDRRLSTWLERMLAKAPEDRFPSADEAWEALEDVVLDLLGPRWRREARLVRYAQAGAHPLAPATFEEEREPKTRSHNWRRPAAIVVVLAVLAGSGIAVGVAASGGGPGANRRLADILLALSRTRAAAIAQLDRAATAKAEAEAASQIARVYTVAADRVHALPRTAASFSIGHDIDRAAAAYRSLATAANYGNRTAYARAASQIRANELQLQAMARRL
jgi:tRNA A-37 threonylcarbamoyl transferase component Bud32